MRSYEDHKRILELWAEGLTHTEIARKLDIPRGTVRTSIERYGTVVELNRSKIRPDVIDYEMYKHILELWEQGYSKVDIAKMTEYGIYQVRECLNQFKSLHQLSEAAQEGTSYIDEETRRTYFYSYRPRERRYTDDQLRDAVATSFSYASTLRKLGVRPAGGNYEIVKKRIEELDLDTSHFRGMGWAKGRKQPVAKKRSLEDIMVKDSTYIGSSKLRVRLLQEGIFEHRCMSCGLDTWLEQPIPLELHHINGEKFDHRLENLQLLCPNCHALTDTYRGKNMNVAPTTNGQLKLPFEHEG